MTPPGGAPTNGLVIFDCDGVLVDSEPIAIAVLRETIAEAGGSIDEAEAYRRFLGRSMAAIAADLAAEGVVLSETALAAMRGRLYRRFEAALAPVEGIAEALDRLGRPLCVASSSQPERIRLALRVTGLLERFEPHIYSSTMVDHGKPAPDLFLLAARSRGAAPSACTVIEDSPAGIEAAKRAGMRVFGFLGGSHAGPAGLAGLVAAARPDRVFDDMRLLPDLIDGGGPAAKTG